MRRVNSPVEGPWAPATSEEPAAPPAPGPPDATQPTGPGSPLVATAGTSSGEACPSCGSHMAADQRYCLRCGHRRGDPRLPFMDAVVFMEAVKAPPRPVADAAPPPPPSERRSGITANASLIAGVGTLLLALGIGVLIGKTGEGNSPGTAAAPQVITVGGAGGATASTGAEAEAEAGGSAAAKGGGGKNGGGASKAKGKEGLETGSSGQTKGVEEVLKPAPGVDLPPPEVQKGGSCESGTAGCEGGKFNGDFFK